MTPADRDAMARFPKNDWFALNKVHYMVRRARWRCERLKAAGFLEMRVEGEYPSLETQYRVVARPPQ